MAYNFDIVLGKIRKELSPFSLLLIDEPGFPVGFDADHLRRVLTKLARYSRPGRQWLRCTCCP